MQQQQPALLACKLHAPMDNQQQLLSAAVAAAAVAGKFLVQSSNLPETQLSIKG